MGEGSGNDEALWVRSLAGDEAAFAALFDRHGNRVFGHARRLVNDRHTAQDVTAATFLELWRCRHRVRLVNASVAPWLLVTATNVARNQIRTLRRHRRLLERLPRVGDAPDAAEVVLSQSILGVDDRLAAALRSLRSADLQLFCLVALEGYSVAEAGQVLNLSPSSAKSRLHRARIRMRHFIDDTDRPAPPPASVLGGTR
jgi:RNA polymerase sigma-70 factor (ECF subfamily)